MVGKIVNPLVKFIKEKTAKKLEFTCKWSLVDYVLRLSICDIEILILKRI